MVIDIPYYTFDEDNEYVLNSFSDQVYIDDDDLKELLIGFLGEDVSSVDIEKLLDAASDENMSEEEFDKIMEDFILKNKK